MREPSGDAASARQLRYQSLGPELLAAPGADDRSGSPRKIASWSIVANRGACARTLAAGMRNADANAFASCSAC